MHDRTFELIYNCDGANKTYQENESNVINLHILIYMCDGNHEYSTRKRNQM